MIHYFSDTRHVAHVKCPLRYTKSHVDIYLRFHEDIGKLISQECHTHTEGSSVFRNSTRGMSDTLRAMTKLAETI